MRRGLSSQGTHFPQAAPRPRALPRPADTSPHPPQSFPGGGETGRPRPGFPRCYQSCSHPCGVCVRSWAGFSETAARPRGSTAQVTGLAAALGGWSSIIHEAENTTPAQKLPQLQGGREHLPAQGSMVPSWALPCASDHGHERIIQKTKPPPKGTCKGTPRACPQKHKRGGTWNPPSQLNERPVLPHGAHPLFQRSAGPQYLLPYWGKLF